MEYSIDEEDAKSISVGSSEKLKDNIEISIGWAGYEPDGKLLVVGSKFRKQCEKPVIQNTQNNPEKTSPQQPQNKEEKPYSPQVPSNPALELYKKYRRIVDPFNENPYLPFPY